MKAGPGRDSAATMSDVTSNTSVDAILARHGEERLSPEEFGRYFGSLPSDDEG